MHQALLMMHLRVFECRDLDCMLQSASLGQLEPMELNEEQVEEEDDAASEGVWPLTGMRSGSRIQVLSSRSSSCSQNVWQAANLDSH